MPILILRKAFKRFYRTYQANSHVRRTLKGFLSVYWLPRLL